METESPGADRSESTPTSFIDGVRRNYPREVQYVVVAVVLACITSVEVATYYAPHFPAWNWGDKAGLITVLLVLMAVKFWTVAYFFMHLKFDKPILTRLFYAGVLVAAGVYVSVLSMFTLWWPGRH